MELEEEDALYRELRRFTGDEASYPHPSQTIVYTEGVRRLMEQARVSWFVDLIASLQGRAFEDPPLRNFQFWELHIVGHGALAVCSRDSEEEAFREEVPRATSALRYICLYVMAGVLHLPTETACRRLPYLRQRSSSTT